MAAHGRSAALARQRGRKGVPLVLGQDLTHLGLNLNSTECLYATFASPWADAPAQRDPEFSLPQCYYMQPPALKTGHFAKFQLETLFYIFCAPMHGLRASHHQRTHPVHGPQCLL